MVPFGCCGSFRGAVVPSGGWLAILGEIVLDRASIVKLGVAGGCNYLIFGQLQPKFHQIDDFWTGPAQLFG